MNPFESPAVARVFHAYPPKMRGKLLALRSLIFETAASTEGVGKLGPVFTGMQALSSAPRVLAYPRAP